MLQWFMNFLIKKSSNTEKETGIKSENKKFTEELHKPIYKSLKKRKVHLSFKDNVFGADLICN